MAKHYQPGDRNDYLDAGYDDGYGPEGEDAFTQGPSGNVYQGDMGRHAQGNTMVRGVRGSHAAMPVDKKTAKKMAKASMPAYLRKSRRMRRLLIAVVIVLLALLALGVFFTLRLLDIAEDSAVQQVQTHQDAQETTSLDTDAAQDAASTTKKTAVPDLVVLLGMNQEQAIEALAHGAQVSTTRDIAEDGNPIKKEVRVALTTEPADARTGTPTVYLGLDEAGVIIQAGYSSSTSSLGYGSLSFADAVTNEHIVEKTLEEAGVEVAEGSISIPTDKTEYSTYASDGTTLTKEYCSFSGEVDIAGALHGWSAVLSYDYMTANATGNLADTIRTIYVYVDSIAGTAPAEQPEDAE